MGRYFSTAPEIRCPSCTRRFDHRAHWEITIDAEVTCENCGAVLVLEDEEAVRHWTWAQKAPPQRGAEGERDA